MIEVATAINSFASKSTQADASQSEEPVFILTSSQLQAVIEAATEPLKEQIAILTDRVNLLCKYQDRQEERLDSLQKKPTASQQDRADILRALLVANGGKMLAKDARKKMHLIKPRFSELLATMKDDIEIRPYHLKKNQKILVLK